MRYFIDTEFIELGPKRPLYLLSVGIVAEDGREFYIENKEAPVHLANKWVKENVIPNLEHFGEKCKHNNADYINKECPAVKYDLIGKKIKEFIGNDNPVFWGYFADYDWVIFCQTFGSMIGLPKGWPMYCNDIVQVANTIEAKLDKDTVPSEYNHNALTDAIWTKKAFEYLFSQLKG